MEVRLPTPAGREERQKQGSSRKYLQTLRLSSCFASASHPVSFLGHREIRGGKDGKQRITSTPDFLFHPKKNGKPLKNFNLGSEVVKTAFKCTFSSILIITRQKDGGEEREGERKKEV